MSDRPIGQETFSPAIGKAAAYQRWIFDLIKPAIGSRLLEIGVGSVPFSRLYPPLISWYPADIDSTMVAEAVQIGSDRLPSTQILGIVGDAGTSEFWNKVRAHHQPDSIIAVNVMEHILDDVGFLKNAFDVLPEDGSGRMALFVPALPSIYGSMDASAGHYRRYRKNGLASLATSVGFEIESLQYVNAPGILYWWWRGKVRKTTDLTDPMLLDSISRIDRYAVPLIRMVEDRISPPIGQSLVIRLRKKSRV